MSERKGEIEIEPEDIRMIMQDDYAYFPKIVESCFCRHCKRYTTTITNYKAFLNKLEDIILRGECLRCGRPVAKYIETGESKKSAEVARHIRYIIKNYKKL